MEVCRSNNTSGWFIAIYGYKGCLLVMGVYMAWEARHVKVQALNDSQYIGICVYAAFSSAIIVVLSSFLSEYPTFSYLATTTSILASTTITLVLLFLPKLKGVLGRVESEDPIMQSMGLKYEYNTRRLVTDDARELAYRMEVQNKVYKCELRALDVEIARLEELLSRPPSRKSSDVYSITNADNSAVHLAVPAAVSGRASWPSTHNRISAIYDPFAASFKVNKEASEQLREKCRLRKLKKLFGSIPSVEDNPAVEMGKTQCVVRESVKEKPRSDPEFITHTLATTEALMPEAKSNSVCAIHQRQ